MFDKVQVDAKVLRVDDSQKVSGELTKQDVHIADATLAAKVTAWEKDAASWKEGNSYRLSNVVVCSYQKSKYLSVPKDGATIEEIDDVGKVADNDGPDDLTILGAEVISVAKLEDYSACIRCKSKVEETKGKLGNCTRCNMQQRFDKCKKHLSTKIVVSSGQQYYTFNVFGTNVNDIADGEDVTEESLLSARPFMLTYDQNVITSIRR